MLFMLLSPFDFTSIIIFGCIYFNKISNIYFFFIVFFLIILIYFQKKINNHLAALQNTIDKGTRDFGHFS